MVTTIEKKQNTIAKKCWGFDIYYCTRSFALFKKKLLFQIENKRFQGRIQMSTTYLDLNILGKLIIFRI